MPTPESCRGGEDGVEGAADSDETCDVVVAWLGCSAGTEGLRLLFLAPASTSFRGRFLGPMVVMATLGTREGNKTSY